MLDIPELDIPELDIPELDIQGGGGVKAGKDAASPLVEEPVPRLLLTRTLLILIDIKVSRLRGFFVKQVVVDKRNFLTFVTHRNYGDFQGDYSVRVIQYIENQGELTEVIPHPESPLQHAAEHSARLGRDKDLTITIRKGENENSLPARGRVMSNLLSDKREMTAVLNHFNLLGKTVLAAKPTPGIPSS